VQFGEGGAGTFSDGKLYSQIKDPRHLRAQGAGRVRQGRRAEEILYVSKPHIGTFRLVKHGREHARRDQALGGEIRFQQRVTDLLIEETSARRPACAACVVLARRRAPPLRADHVVLAWATARATPLPCCTSGACSWRPSRSRSAFASSTRSR
jgi:uncharacterized FAD-dependent dehydrogenase